MATALQQQLAAIAANSTQQLDLKAQKGRHSKSLLFEPRDAASQSFDTIFQICNEGFEELCMLDGRFMPFARNLFSEQSKIEDRTQLMAKENEELDRVLESFLGLVGGRLLLKPGLKAIEWLVRRFRVQEYNTEAVLLTFLPYHTSHIFTTLLSILPEQLPPNFRFLNPYIKSLQSPPRHAILTATTNNPGLFTAFSQYTLRVAKARHQSAVLVGFWASITAQAVNGMIDASRSGRENVRKQREEDLLLRVLPILQSALSIGEVPELYLSACMIMTILVTRAELQDKAINAMMQAVAGSWTSQTIDDGFVCLAIMAEERQQLSLPAPVMRALLSSELPVERMQRLSRAHRFDRLALSTATNALDLHGREDDNARLSVAASLLELGLLQGSHLKRFCMHLITTATERAPILDNGSSQKLVTLLSNTLELPGAQETLQQAGYTVQQLETSLSASFKLAAIAEAPVEDTDAMDVDGKNNTDGALDKILEQLPNPEEGHSFLGPNSTDTFDIFHNAFLAAYSSETHLSQLFSKPALRRKRCLEQPGLLSFLARTWSSALTPLPIKVKALATALEASQSKKDAHVDMQALLPYILAALSDPMQSVRNAAAQLALHVDGMYGAGNEKSTVSKDLTVWAKDSLYGAESAKIKWLPSNDAHKFFATAVKPFLEECVLDGSFVIRALTDALDGSTHVQSTSSEGRHLKSALRESACSSLATHVAVTPSIQAKMRILQVLNNVGKPAVGARTQIMVPFVKTWAAQGGGTATTICESQGANIVEVNKAILSSLSHRSADELQLLKDIASGEMGEEGRLPALAIKQLAHLWRSMKTNSQIALADFLVETALEPSASSDTTPIQAESMDTLRNLRLPTEVVVHLVESLPNVGDSCEPNPAKKRRTSKGMETTNRNAMDATKANEAIKRITVVLELVESSKPEQHPQLLKGLFHLLSELHHYATALGSDLTYLQGVLLGCILSVVKGLQSSPNQEIDRSVIRADLIVECVRSTANSQVHNAALLLISNLASWAPDLVLHSVMPIFTFMSTTLLRQSDDYSAHVTNQTVARVVPPLAASLKKRGKDLITGASELLLSFTAAFEHIPLHRRPGLFEHLIQTLGPSESLYALMAMLVVRYPLDQGLQTFLQDLMTNFDVTVQLSAARQYMDLMADARKPKRNISDLILGYGDMDDEERHDSTVTLVEQLANILKSKTLHKQIARALSKDDKTAETLRATYAQLLERVLQLTGPGDVDEELKAGADALLSSLLSLFPTKDFIESSAQLVVTGSPEIREQVFSSLEARARAARRSNTAEAEVFLEALPNCMAFIRSDQPYALRHAAINCIDQIVDKYGKLDKSAVLEVAEAVAGEAALGCADKSSTGETEEGRLRNASILCLASMVEVLQDDFIPILPKVLTKVLDYQDENAEFGYHESIDGRDFAVQEPAFALHIAILDNIPWMFSSEYLDRALALGWHLARIDAVAPAEFSRLAARKVKAEEYFESADQVLRQMDRDVNEVSRCIDSVHLAIKHHTKPTIAKCASTLFHFLLEAFDLRRQTWEDTADEDFKEEWMETYPKVDALALDMTLKLSDATFRPFFIRLKDWVEAVFDNRQEYRDSRALSFWSFVLTLSEQLKSIVTNYASVVLEDLKILTQLKGENETQRYLASTIVQTLTSFFNHDQDDFWQAPQHFEAAAQALLPLLASRETLALPRETLISAVEELAVAAASREHLKEMNTQLLEYMRHEEAGVRALVVECQRALTQRLQMDWLEMLPQMIPPISEGQEDEDENVERLVMAWVTDIEEVTGESLQEMLR
ncbi:hypothetical protein MBLNU230_g1875t1 [Neophaeotheca triangularis]